MELRRVSSVETKRFEIKTLLGEGGFGKVYKASLRGPDGFRKDVAIKILHETEPRPAVLKRFKDEARILGLVRDRAIVVVDSPSRIGNRWAVVMELVDGASAGAVLKKGPFPPGVAVEVVGEIARVLNKVWTHPGPDGQPLHLLHRDIKPDNIQLTTSGEIKLLDFGIAKADFDGREFHTRQSIGGTPGYMAPERLLGIEGPEGDVYSLGIMLHELVTGVRPVPDGVLSRSTGSHTVDVDSEEFDPASLEGDLPAAPPAVDPVLDLARRMSLEDRTRRPVARDVERECAELRRRLSGPSLRDWAEHAVTDGGGLPADDLVGAVVTETMSFPLTTSTSHPLPAPTPRSRSSRLPWIVGALVVLAGLGLVGVVAVGVTFGLTYTAVSTARPQVEPVPGSTPDPEPPPPPEPVVAEPPGPEPEPVALAPVTPEPVEPVAPEPVAPAPVTPEPPAPEPHAPAPMAPEPQAPAPVVAPVPAPVAPAPATPGSFVVTGDADSFKLVDTNGLRYGPGEPVPPGKYSMFATFPIHGEIDLGTATIRAGHTTTFVCSAGQALCKEK